MKPDIPMIKSKYHLYPIILILTLLMVSPAYSLGAEVQSMCRRAESLINQRNFREAIKILKEAEEMEPDSGEVHGYLGMAYQNSSKTDKAIVEYEQALKLNPSMSFINVNLGTCYMNLNQLDKAVPFFQAYLNANPEAPDRARIESYINQAGARSNQNNLKSMTEQGQAFLNQGRNQEAQNVFQQIVQTNPGWAPGHFYLGYARAKLGNHEGAIQEFQTALNLDPSQSEAILNIGSNYQSAGNIRAAISWYERYLGAAPNSPKARDIRNRVEGLKKEAARNNQNQGSFNQAYQNPQSGGQPIFRAPQNSPPGQSGFQNTPPIIPEDNYLNSAAVGGRFFRWSPQAMPIRVFIAESKELDSYRPVFNEILKEAFSKWARASLNRLSFVQVASPNQANILCFWTNNPEKIAEKGKTVEGGLTRISGKPQPGSPIVSISQARITILTRPRSGDSKELSDDDMMKVCLHEVGHALGINGHSTNNKDIMFYSESPSIWPALTKRDKATIRALYSR